MTTGEKEPMFTNVNKSDFKRQEETVRYFTQKEIYQKRPKSNHQAIYIVAHTLQKRAIQLIQGFVIEAC
jgi:uncharacterized protein with PIN domain